MDELLTELNNFDQSAPDRGDAERNVQVLTDDEVVEKIFATADEARIMNYYLARGLAEFHVGQYYACIHEDVDTALRYFKAALESDIIVGFNDMVAYTQATIAFMEQDVATLRSLVATQACNRNHG